MLGNYSGKILICVQLLDLFVVLLLFLLLLSPLPFLLPATPRLPHNDDRDGEMQRGWRREGGRRRGEGGGGREYRLAQSMTSWALSLSCVYSVSLAPRLFVQTCFCRNMHHVLFVIFSIQFIILITFLISSDISSITHVFGEVPHK